MSEQDTFCGELVRQQDTDAFLATLFAPEAAQPHLYALQAFAAELARIPTQVSDAQIGEIRLQWWADTLASIAAGPGNAEHLGHPVAEGLARTVHAHGLPVAPLAQMIEARRFDIYADTMPDMLAVEAYFGETQAALMQLGCLVLNASAAASAAEAAGLAGVAFGLSRHLCRHTADKLVPAGKSREDVLQLVEKRLTQARQVIRQVPKTVLPALMPLALADLYLAAARAGRSNVPQWRRQWRLWRVSRTERF